MKTPERSHQWRAVSPKGGADVPRDFRNYAGGEVVAMRKNARIGLTSGSGNAERRWESVGFQTMHELDTNPFIGRLSGKAGGAVRKQEAVSRVSPAIEGFRVFSSQTELPGVGKMRLDKALARLAAAFEKHVRQSKLDRIFAGSETKLLFLPFCFLLVAASPQQEETNSASGESQLRCMVNGYDVVLINDGAEEIPVGTVVGWSVPAARMGNDYTLTRPLGASESRFLTAVLGSNYMNPRSECQVQIRPPA